MVAMNGRAWRAPVGDGVARWFVVARRGDPEAVDGLLRAVFPTAQRSRLSAARADRMVVAVALAVVSAARREVIVVVDLLDLPVERTAGQLGIGVRAAKGRLHRARRALTELIEQPELGGSA
jgi:DNA-directed RNA polymerase specialized sigma24 family protein